MYISTTIIWYDVKNYYRKIQLMAKNLRRNKEILNEKTISSLLFRTLPKYVKEKLRNFRYYSVNHLAKDDQKRNTRVILDQNIRIIFVINEMKQR